jgi:hypothetical protein
MNVDKHPQPFCGVSSNFEARPLDEELIDWSDPNANVTVNVTFTPLLRKTQPKPLYYVAFYGEAQRFSDAKDVSSFQN